MIEQWISFNRLLDAASMVNGESPLATFLVSLGHSAGPQSACAELNLH
jgi:hypothetical protein